MVKKYYYTRRHLYQQFVNEFERVYSWLGRQVAEEFLLSLAGWNIDHYTNQEWRVRQHILMFWQPAWYKSTFLNKFREILDIRKCKLLTDVSNAALRGTIDKGIFIPPLVVTYPFMTINEIAKITKSSDKDLLQTFLMVLEEGVGSASYAKFATLKEPERKEIEKKYSRNSVIFTDDTSFEYKTDTLFLCATYKDEFIEDDAFQSRFNIIIPQRELTGELTKYVDNQEPLNITDEMKKTLRYLIFKKPPMKFEYDLSDEIYDNNPTPRDSGKLKSWAYSRQWWGFEVDDILIEARFNHNVTSCIQARLTNEDKIIELLTDNEYDITTLCKEIGISRTWAYRVINRNNRFIKTRKDGKKTLYKFV